MKLAATFKGEDVIQLLDDAKKHDKHYLTMGQREDILGEINHVEGEESKGSPGLWFVKDDGCYLMSNSYPKRKGPIYAKGKRPEDGHIGGDDFVEFIGADDLQDVQPDDEIVIEVYDEKFSITVMRLC